MQAKEFLDLEAREVSEGEEEDEEEDEEDEEEDAPEDEELYIEEEATLEQVTPEKAEEMFAATPIKVKRIQKKGAVAASVSATRRASAGGRGTKKRLNPDAAASPKTDSKRAKKEALGEKEMEARRKLQGLAETRVLLEAYKNREVREPKDPFVAEQLRQLVKLLELRPKPRHVRRGAYLNECALQIVDEDRLVIDSLPGDQDEEQEVLEPSSQQHHGQAEGSSGSQAAARKEEGQRQQLQDNKGEKEKGLLPLPKALQKVNKGRPDLQQLSVAVEVGEGFEVYLAKKTWNSEGNSPRSSQCLVVERRYTDRGGGSKSFSINVGLETALEIARVAPILINELTC